MSRLGTCDVCNYSDAKYTCPATNCQIKSCSLVCSQNHKKELKCSGVRNKTEYKQIKQLNETDLQRDYQLLEECTNYTAARRIDDRKKITRFRSLPGPLARLRSAARQRGITFDFLSSNFTKHKKNTSSYDNKTKTISWHIEWNFIDVESNKTEELCKESDTLSSLIDKYLKKDSLVNTSSDGAVEEKAAVNVLLKAEGVPNNKNRYYLLDKEKTLGACLVKRRIIEFPSIFVIIGNERLTNYDLIDEGELAAV